MIRFLQMGYVQVRNWIQYMLNVLWRMQNTFHQNTEEEKITSFCGKAKGWNWHVEISLWNMDMIYYSPDRKVAHSGKCCKQTRKQDQASRVQETVNCPVWRRCMSKRVKSSRKSSGKSMMGFEYQDKARETFCTGQWYFQSDVSEKKC